MTHFVPRGGGSQITTALKFTAEGLIETTSGDLAIEPATGYITKFGAAFVTNHGLNTNQDVGINGKLEANGHIYGDNGASIGGSTFYASAGAVFSSAWTQFTYGTLHADNARLTMGQDSNVEFTYRTNQTPDTWCWGVGADSRHIVIAERADFLVKDFAHALEDDPTIFLQASDHTDADKYLRMTWDEITTGKSNLTLGPASGYYTVLSSIKTTTGHPTGVEGLIYINTADNGIFMYADSAWRTLASW